MSKLHYGFLDESGILEKKAKEGKHFVVELKDIMKLSKRRVRGKFKTHAIFHAYKENEGFVKVVLDELVKRNVGIIIGVWDKREKKPRVSKNAFYGKLVAQTAELTLDVYPKLNLVLHKRYNDPEIINQINNELGKVLKAGWPPRARLAPPDGHRGISLSNGRGRHTRPYSPTCFRIKIYHKICLLSIGVS